MLFLSEELMSCCAAGTNGCLDLRRCASALDGRVSAEWSRCLGSMARHARDTLAALRRSSADWPLARMVRLSAVVESRHPITICKALFMDGSIRRMWVLQHQTRAQYSAVECTRAKVSVRNVVARASAPESATRLNSAMRDVIFLRSDSSYQRYAPSLSNVTPRYMGSRQKGRIRCGSWLLAHASLPCC